MHPLSAMLLGLGLVAADPIPPAQSPGQTGASAPAPAAAPATPQPLPWTPVTPEIDLAHLREVLHDRLDPRGQSQAALLLVQSSDPAAEKMVRRGLRQPEDPEVFLALLAAVRLRQDGRFLDDVLEVLTGNHPRMRPAAAETLAAMTDPLLVGKLEAVVTDVRHEQAVRQAALWTLGRTGRKSAAEALINALGCDNPDLRKVAAAALSDLTGQNYGPEGARWKAWWARHKALTNEQWLEMRLAYQVSRTQRLESDLARSRTQVVRLHQQLYARLPVAERPAHLTALLEMDDPAVRALAVVWAVELLPTADADRHKQLAGLLLQLSNDGTVEVQRGAVLALGRVNEAAAFDRLCELLKSGQPAVRAASARALGQHGRSTEPGGGRSKEVIPVLQKSLDDPALEVVIEAAEALGGLGAPAAGPVLTNLLRHPAETVRRTAAQALERVADATVMDGLLKGLDDPNVTVRFSLVGAIGRAAGDGQTVPEEVRQRLLARLEQLLGKDADPGVRSRAATVLGEFAAPALLDVLWKSVATGADGRVQEKAWDAFVETIARSGNPALLQQWARTLGEARQGSRRVQLLTLVATRWGQRADTRAAAVKAQEALVQVNLELGKWQAAWPVVKELLARAEEPELPQRLASLLAVGQRALEDGHRADALRVFQDAQPYLPRAGTKLAAEFERFQQSLGKD